MYNGIRLTDSMLDCFAIVGGIRVAQFIGIAAHQDEGSAFAEGCRMRAGYGGLDRHKVAAC